jgi:hypothetical protein
MKNLLFRQGRREPFSVTNRQKSGRLPFMSAAVYYERRAAINRRR